MALFLEEISHFGLFFIFGWGLICRVFNHVECEKNLVWNFIDIDFSIDWNKVKTAYVRKNCRSLFSRSRWYLVKNRHRQNVRGERTYDFISRAQRFYQHMSKNIQLRGISLLYIRVCRERAKTIFQGIH